MALYAKMRETQQRMSKLGEKASLPSAEDLRIMNVSNMTPEQLLQLCAGDDTRGNQWDGTFRTNCRVLYVSNILDDSYFGKRDVATAHAKG